MGEIGDNIRRARILREMTQEYVSNELNISRQSISRWENGRGYPDVEKLVKLSVLYDVTMDYLLLGKDDPSVANKPSFKSGVNCLTFKVMLVVGFLSTLLGHLVISTIM